jgi:hypothetical protein
LNVSNEELQKIFAAWNEVRYTHTHVAVYNHYLRWLSYTHSLFIQSRSLFSIIT